MKNLVIVMMLMYCVSMTACLSSRYTTHWIVNNDSNKEVALNLNVKHHGSNHQKVKVYNIKPGLQEITSQSLPRGAYSVIAETDDGTVSKARQMYFDSDSWVIISFTNADSIEVKRKYGYVDTSVMKKVDGLYTGMAIYKETRKPPFLWNVSER